MSKRFLVTGGAGFIGSHLVHHLLGNDRKVTVLDNFSTGLRKNLEGLAGDLEVVEGGCQDEAAVAKAIQDVQGVFHIAALPSVVRSVEAPVESHDANVTGAAVVLDAARRNECKVVYAGSSSAYGDQDCEYKVESLREDPLSPYAATKLAGELYCRSFSKVYGMPTVVTRFFNVFGPRQVPDSPYSGVVAAFCFSLLRGTVPRVDGDGMQSRDFTYVEDVVRGLGLAMDADTQGSHVANLACGGSYTVLDLLRILKEHAGSKVEPQFAPTRNGDVRDSKSDSSYAAALFGFAPQVSFEEGLRRTYDWYRSEYS